MKKTVFISLICAFIGACGGSYFDAGVATKYPEGLELYLSKCGGCHRLHQRNEYSDEKWSEIIFRMQKKARTSDRESDEIYRFLTETDSVKTSSES